MENQKTCKNCKHWSREKTVYTFPDHDFPDVEAPSRLGRCCIANKSIGFWESPAEIEAKVKPGFIGGDNLYFDENFGCIHFEK